MVYNRAHYPKSEKMEVLENRTEPERYAVEARIFNTGKIITKIRPAESWEENNMEETRTCDIWTDVFDSKEAAEGFCRQYQMS